jgi:hypothetical protein
MRIDRAAQESRQDFSISWVDFNAYFEKRASDSVWGVCGKRSSTPTEVDTHGVPTSDDRAGKLRKTDFPFLTNPRSNVDRTNGM